MKSRTRPVEEKRVWRRYVITYSDGRLFLDDMPPWDGWFGVPGMPGVRVVACKEVSMPEGQQKCRLLTEPFGGGV